MGVDLIFQQDNCPSHVSSDIKEKLSKMRRLDFWPPNSPDLSPIESVWSEVQSKLEGYTFKNMEDFRKKIVYEWNRVPVEYCQRICRKFWDDIQQIYKFGRIKEKHHMSKGLNFKQKGVYTDEIENIVFNKVSLRNVIKFNIKDIKKVNKKLKPIIHKLRRLTFKKKIQDELNIESFDHIYNEILKENEDIYMKNKSRISKLKRMKLEDYFNSLTKSQQIKLCNLVARYNDDIKFDGQPQNITPKVSLGDKLIQEEEKLKAESLDLTSTNKENTNANPNDITTNLSEDKTGVFVLEKKVGPYEGLSSDSDSSSDSNNGIELELEEEEKKEEPVVKRRPGRPRKVPENPKAPFVINKRGTSKRNTQIKDVIDLEKENININNNGNENVNDNNNNINNNDNDINGEIIITNNENNDNNGEIIITNNDNDNDNNNNGDNAPTNNNDIICLSD